MKVDRLLDLLGLIIDDRPDCREGLNHFAVFQGRAWRVIDDPITLRETPDRRGFTVSELSKSSANTGVNMVP